MLLPTSQRQHNHLPSYGVSEAADRADRKEVERARARAEHLERRRIEDEEAVALRRKWQAEQQAAGDDGGGGDDDPLGLGLTDDNAW